MGRRPLILDGVAQLLVAEIYDLSLLQFMTVAALIRIVGDAELTIQAAPHKVNASRFADLTWNRFVGEESIADQVLPEFVRRDGRAGQLGFVLAQLFTDADPTPPPVDGTVRVIEAANLRDEAEAVAYTIRRMLESDRHEISLRRIAIVARHLSPYDDHLEAAFRRYRLPLIHEHEPSLRATMPARAVLEILHLVLDGLPREGLITLCDNAFIQIAAKRYRTLPRETGYLDRGTRPLPECIENRKQALRAAYEAAAPEARPSIANQLARLERGASAWADLLDALDALEAPASVPDQVERLVALLSRLGFDPAAGSLMDSAARATGPLWRALDELAVEAARVAPDRVVTLREFADLLEAVLRDVRLEPASADGGDAVRAIPILEARGLDFDLVFILGLNDEVFPRYYPDDPLVPEEIVRSLDRALRARLKARLGDGMPDAPGPLLRSRGDRNSEEPFLFFLAMSMPANAIVLSCAVEDEAGRPLRRSPFLEEVLRRIGGEDRVETIGRGDFAPLDDCFAERDWLNRAASRHLLESLPADGGLTPARLESIFRRIAIENQRTEYLSRPIREVLFEDRSRAQKGPKKDSPRKIDWLDPAVRAADPQKRLRASEYDGRVAPNARLVKALLESPEGAPRQWSAKQLSEMAVCGFNFFARRILRLRDADELEHEPTRLETGDVVHHILRDFFNAGPNFANPESAFELAAEVAERWRLSVAADARDPAFFDLAWMAVREMIHEVVAYEITRRAEGHVPDELAHEYRLEFPLELSPVAGAGGTRIPLVGSIDRLELYREAHGDRERRDAKAIARIRVVDYKTSRSLDRLAKLLTPGRFATTDLQMPVYLLGAITQLHDRLASGVAVEASYIALQRREKEAVPLGVPLELLDSRAPGVATVAARVRELVSDAMDGRFDVDPLECSDWCPYRPVCRFEKTAGS
jgi:ATP-dependent helicase/nuclease subunit B